MKGLELTAYDNSGKRHPLRFWYTEQELHIFTPFANTRVALSRDIPWRKNAAYINTKGCTSVAISVGIQGAMVPFRLYWDLYQFDRTGNMLGTLHPRPIDVTTGWKNLLLPTAYPRMLSSRMLLETRTSEIAFVFSFYLEPGGICVNAIDITGYR